MTDFKQVLAQYPWERVKQEIESKTTVDVQRALHCKEFDLDSFKALLSPAAEGFLEELARRSHLLTAKRFGKTVQMYIPLYLSNECQNICTYCGFSFTQKIPRKTLTEKELHTEMQHLKALGFDHILLVSGEANQRVGVDYFEKACQIAQQYFTNISLEVQPLEQLEYERLKKVGLHSILVYQETYHREVYKNYHPKGKKSNFDYRLDTPDRIGKAGIHKTGLGFLLGLENWRVEAFYTGLHLRYLRKKYWQSTYTISFPRLRPHAGQTAPNYVVTDKQLVQLITAYRLFDHDVELSISTRETQRLRNHIVPLGITSMSAGSKTNPGGYVVEPQSLEQFEIEDYRSPREMTEIIVKQGYEPVWKNWSEAYNG